MMPGHLDPPEDTGRDEVFSQHVRDVKAFGPEATQCMAAAFDQAWQELQAMGHVSTASFRATATREKLACRILELADDGEDDPSILKDYAVAYFIWPLSPAPISSQRGWLGERP